MRAQCYPQKWQREVLGLHGNESSRWPGGGASDSKAPEDTPPADLHPGDHVMLKPQRTQHVRLAQSLGRTYSVMTPHPSPSAVILLRKPPTTSAGLSQKPSCVA